MMSNTNDQTHLLNVELGNNDEGLEIENAGKGRGQNVSEWGVYHKEKLKFREDDQCVGGEDARFVRYLGSLARNGRVIPLSLMDWRLFPEKDKLWTTISATIDWHAEDLPHLPAIREVAMSRISHILRNYKNALKSKYYTPNVEDPLHFECGDKRVFRHQWVELVKHWDKTESKNLCDKNAKSRAELKMSHTAGTMTFTRLRAKFEKEYGHPPDEMEFFDYTHRHRRENGRPYIDNASEQLGMKMNQELHHLVGDGESTTELRQRAYVKARGPERRDRVRGYSIGVTPDMVPWVETEIVSSSKRLRKWHECYEMKAKYGEMCEKYEDMKKQQEEMKENMKKQQEEMKEYLQRLQLHSYMQQPMYYPQNGFLAMRGETNGLISRGSTRVLSDTSDSAAREFTDMLGETTVGSMSYGGYTNMLRENATLPFDLLDPFVPSNPRSSS